MIGGPRGSELGGVKKAITMASMAAADAQKLLVHLVDSPDTPLADIEELLTSPMPADDLKKCIGELTLFIEAVDLLKRHPDVTAEGAVDLWAKTHEAAAPWYLSSPKGLATLHEVVDADKSPAEIHADWKSLCDRQWDACWQKGYSIAFWSLAPAYVGGAVACLALGTTVGTMSFAIICGCWIAVIMTCFPWCLERLAKALCVRRYYDLVGIRFSASDMPRIFSWWGGQLTPNSP